MAEHARQPVVLVDGSSYLFRAFHALPPLSSSKGQPTGAVKGVIAMLRRLIKDYPGCTIAVVFDTGRRSFRHDLYPQYKANRPPMPDDLRAQVQPVNDIVQAMGLPLLRIDGVEADDVIGTLAREATDTGRDVVISTGDKDMAQLVSPHVLLVNTMTETTLDAAGVRAKYGVPPERIVDLLALTGDSTDNIPGVAKVGPKTAAKWLDEFGSLDTLMARAAEVKGKVGENLRAALPLLPLSRQLATIRCDVELPVSLASLSPSPPDPERLRELFTDLEFKAWADELLSAAPKLAPVERHYDTVHTAAALDAWLARLRAAGEFAFDTETTSLDYMRATLVGVSFAVAPGEAAYVPFGHDDLAAPAQLDRDFVLGRLRPLLEDASLGKIGQHVKYDLSVLARAGIALAGVRHDTMLESYVLDSGGRHGLDDLALNHLGVRTITFEDVAGKGARQVSFDKVPVDAASRYAAEDADMALQVHAALWPRLAADGALRRVYEDLELPLTPVLSRMELAGALVDTRVLAQQGAELAAAIAANIERAHALAGVVFNLDSPKQLQEILYERLGLPPQRRTPGGQPSTAEPVLAELAHDYELPRVILAYRAAAKLKSTYTDRLPLQIDATTGRIHTCYHQAVTLTGRLSSSDPNLQNIPIRTPEGRRIRRAFVAPPGRCLLAADYSQIELRIMAHLSGDVALCDVLAQGGDVHRATAAEVFGVSPEAVSDDQRRSAKTINFGLIYGMSAFGLARNLGIPRHLAGEYIERYFTRYPGVRAYMEETRRSAREHGYVETLFGRRLQIPEIRAASLQRRQGAERTAINAPMQGSAADIIKRAMIDVDAWLRGGTLDARMILQVHDELVFEVALDDVEAVTAGVRERMVAAASLDVPLVVDIGTGANWDAAH
jgi:DNA polymerase-1